MAITKAKRSLLTNATRSNNRRVSNRHPDRSKPAERRNPTRSSSQKQLAIGIRQFAESKPKTTKAKKKQSAISGPQPVPASRGPVNTNAEQAYQKHSFTLPKPRRIWFPHANGRLVKQVEFFTDSSNNTLELTFADDTSLSFEFNPAFVWEAYFARWKSGEQRILHRWPQLKS